MAQLESLASAIQAANGSRAQTCFPEHHI